MLTGAGFALPRFGVSGVLSLELFATDAAGRFLLFVVLLASLSTSATTLSKLTAPDSIELTSSSLLRFVVWLMGLSCRALCLD